MANFTELENQRSSRNQRTKNFQWKAADFIANNIRFARGASVIQCNLLEKMNISDTSCQRKVCNFCHCVLAENCHLRLLPRIVPGAKFKKSMKRLQSWQHCDRTVHLSKFELSLLKKCKSKPANSLLLSCSVCHKSQKYLLEKFCRPQKEPKNPVRPKVTTSKEKKKVWKQKSKRNAGLKLVNIRKRDPQNLTSNDYKMKSSTVTLPKKAEPKCANQQNNLLHGVRGKMAKAKKKPEFITKLLKGNKLASLLAQDAASKKAKKDNPKSNIFALLHGWAGK